MKVLLVKCCYYGQTLPADYKYFLFDMPLLDNDILQVSHFDHIEIDKVDMKDLPDATYENSCPNCLVVKRDHSEQIPLTFNQRFFNSKHKCPYL